MKIYLLPFCFGASVFLAGCSSNILPLSSLGFLSDDLTVSDSGVGALNANTRMNEQIISKQLGSEYQLVKGTKIKDNQVVDYFDVYDKNNQQLLTVYGTANQNISSIEIINKKIKTKWGVGVSTPFSNIYYQAADGACQRDPMHDKEVICQVKNNAHLSYVFTGNWNGPSELLPPDNQLMTWEISKIIWYAKYDKKE